MGLIPIFLGEIPMLSIAQEQHLHLMDVREAKSRIDRVDGYRCRLSDWPLAKLWGQRLMFVG